MRQVTLKRVTLVTSGIYRCEVTSKLSPAGIDSEVKEDRLTVLGKNYFVGLQLLFECFFRK